MTDQRELDRLLGAFFVEGTDELADRVIDAALDEIDHTQQRRARRVAWSPSTMSPLIRFAAAAVIGVLAVAGMLVVIQPGQPGVGGPGPTPGASASPSESPSPSPSPVIMPSTATYVAGTETISVTTPGVQALAGHVTRLRGRIVVSADTMNDPRVTGTGTMNANADMYGAVGPQWGTYRLENAGGAWEGTWTGALWDGGTATNVSGWLVGSGAYEGWTYFVHVWGTSSFQVEGVIFNGSPPTTAPLPTPAPSLGSPLATSAPATGAAGPASVTGTGTHSRIGGTEVQMGDVRQYRDLVITSDATMSDPRVTGKGSAQLDGDAYGTVGLEWGRFELKNAAGAWKGSFTGAIWDSLEASDLTFWSVGSGAHAGYTYYQHIRTIGTADVLEGIIFPGPPPTP